MTSGGMNGGDRRGRGVVAALVGLAMLAVGCAGSVTVEGEVGSDDGGEPTSVAEASPAPTDDATPAPTATDDGAAGSDDLGEPPSFEGEVPSFRVESILGLSNDGRFAYATSTLAWDDPPTPCDGPAFQSLAGIDVAAVLPPLAGAEAVDVSVAEPVAFAAGLYQSGDVVQLVFGTDGSAAFTSSCGPIGPGGDGQQWLQTARFGDDGRIGSLGPRLPMPVNDSGNGPWLHAWNDESSVRMRAVIEGADDETYEDWFIEDRVVSTETGEILSAERVPYLSDDLPRNSPTFTSPDGRFDYREIEDPNGGLGCEGFGVASTIEVDDGSGPRLALGEDGPTYSTIDNMHFGPGGLVAWTTGCEGYTSAHVGRISDDGSILDAHGIDTYALVDSGDAYAEYRSYRLADDGSLLAIGARYSENGATELVLLRYDLSQDPQFVETAVRPPRVDRTNPLAPTLEGNGSWYVGETLASRPACGATTLYGDTTTGLARAFPTGTELDEIVELVAAEPRTVTYEPGRSFTTRAIAVLTECPADYTGRRIWFGEEPDKVRFGLYLQQADHPEVADVLSLREVVAPGTTFAESVFAEVVLLDGTVTEIELLPVPYDG